MKLARAFCLVILLAVCGHAQFETAVVLGTVRDASQSVISGANVSLSNLDTGITAKAETDVNGNYLFPNVKVGRYKVSVAKAGFATAFADNVEVNVNARQRVDLQ